MNGFKRINEIYLIYCEKCRKEYFDLESPMGGFTTPLATTCPYCGYIGGAVTKIKRALIRKPTGEEYMNTLKKVSELYKKSK